MMAGPKTEDTMADKLNRHFPDLDDVDKQSGRTWRELELMACGYFPVPRGMTLYRVPFTQAGEATWLPLPEVASGKS
jgi:hypothetical protein